MQNCVGAALLASLRGSSAFEHARCAYSCASGCPCCCCCPQRRSSPRWCVCAQRSSALERSAIACHPLSHVACAVCPRAGLVLQDKSVADVFILSEYTRPTFAAPFTVPPLPIHHVGGRHTVCACACAADLAGKAATLGALAWRLVAPRESTRKRLFTNSTKGPMLHDTRTPMVEALATNSRR